QALTVEHQFAVELVFRSKCARLCEHMTCAHRINLNFCERAVFPQDGERLEKNFIIGPRGPIRQVMHHEVGAEEVGPISPSAIPLASAGKIELRSPQKVVLDVESRIEWILRVFCHERAKKIRTHSRMQILADL